MTISRDPSAHPVVEEYARLAPVYDAKWSFYVEATTRETLARLSLRPSINWLWGLMTARAVKP